MRTMTKVAIGGVGGAVAAGWWAWTLFNEKEALRRENEVLSSRWREAENRLRRAAAELETLRAENGGLKIQLQTLAKTGSKAG